MKQEIKDTIDRGFEEINRLQKKKNIQCYIILIIGLVGVVFSFGELSLKEGFEYAVIRGTLLIFELTVLIFGLVWFGVRFFLTDVKKKILRLKMIY